MMRPEWLVDSERAGYILNEYNYGGRIKTRLCYKVDTSNFEHMCARMHYYSTTLKTYLNRNKTGPKVLRIKKF